MKKNCLFVLLLFMCVGLFFPKVVFALEINNSIYNNIDIDYMIRVIH